MSNAMPNWTSPQSVREITDTAEQYSEQSEIRFPLQRDMLAIYDFQTRKDVRDWPDNHIVVSMY